MQISPAILSRPALTGLLLVILTASLAFAQIGGGSIVGIVHDASGAAVPGVQVIAHNQETNEEHTATTNEEGYYEFPLLPAGRYQVRAEARGFKRIEGAAFTLSTGTRPRIDLTLTVGDLNEKIEVTATAPQVNTTTTDLAVC
jgi:hypothetical protein